MPATAHIEHLAVTKSRYVSVNNVSHGNNISYIQTGQQIERGECWEAGFVTAMVVVTAHGFTSIMC